MKTNQTQPKPETVQASPQGLAPVPLFAFMAEVRKTPSLAAKRREHVHEWKQQHRIFTHKGPDDWMALSMDECCWKLEGYGLTKEQQTDGVMLMAGYCRLIDEAGLIHFGQTEHEACESLVTRLTGANDQAQTPRERNANDQKPTVTDAH